MHIVGGGIITIGIALGIVIGLSVWTAFFDVVSSLVDIAVQWYYGTETSAIQHSVAVFLFWILLAVILFIIGGLFGHKFYSWRYLKKRLSY